MDIITTAEPPLVYTGSPPEVPAAGVSLRNTPTMPLDIIEGSKGRTKLRLYAVLLALYVT